MSKTDSKKTVSSPKKPQTPLTSTTIKKTADKTPIPTSNSKSTSSLTSVNTSKRIEVTTSSQNIKSKTPATASPIYVERSLVTPSKVTAGPEKLIQNAASPTNSPLATESSSLVQNIGFAHLDSAHTTLDDSSVISGISSHTTPTSASGSELIKVCVKIRPMLRVEEEHSSFNGDVNNGNAWIWGGNTIHNPLNKDINYNFDYLFTPENNNTDVYESVVKNVVDSAMHGYHGSVFSYGQTNSGKTFTMNGGPTQPGIIPQAIYHCFNAVNSFPDREFLLRVSYLEVYNEQIKDLLGMDPLPIKIQHDPKLGTVLSGVKEQVVLNPQQVIALIRSGEAHRHVGHTDMNEKSSRAHTLFKLIIESKERNKPGAASNSSSPVKVSTLNLVDLAGSESAKMTNSKGERAREAKHINQSLLTLSTIIQRLSEVSKNPTHKQHLPYRDSKLTRLLESALDGNAHISIICTISPALKCVDESTNTLKFASRAKLIKMSAKLNETVDDKTLLRAYREEIEQLKAKLQQFENVSSTTTSSKTPSQHRRTDSMGSVDNDTDSVLSVDSSLPLSAAAERMEEEQVMLQMIAEMERLILKADLTKGDTASTNNHGAAGGSRSATGGATPTLKRSGDSKGTVNAMQKLKTATTFSDLTDQTIDVHTAEKKRRSRGHRKSRSKTDLTTGSTQSPDASAKRLTPTTSSDRVDYLLGSPRLIPVKSAKKQHGHAVSLLTASYDGPLNGAEKSTHKHDSTLPLSMSPQHPIGLTRKASAATLATAATLNINNKPRASPTLDRPRTLHSAKSMSVMPRTGSSLLSVSKVVPHTVASVLAASGSASWDDAEGLVVTPVKTHPPVVSLTTSFMSPLSNSSSSDTYGKGTWKDVPTPAPASSDSSAFSTADSDCGTPLNVKGNSHISLLTPTIESTTEGDNDEVKAECSITPPLTPKSLARFGRDSFIGPRVDLFESLVTPKTALPSPSKTPRGSGSGKNKKKTSFETMPSTEPKPLLPLDLPFRSKMKRSQTMPMQTMLSLSQQSDWDLADAESPLSSVASTVAVIETNITSNSESRRGSLARNDLKILTATSPLYILKEGIADDRTTPFSALTSPTLMTSPHTPLVTNSNNKSIGDFFDVNSSDVTLVESCGEEEDEDEVCKDDYYDDEEEEYSETSPSPSRHHSLEGSQLGEEEVGEDGVRLGDESVLFGVTKMLSFLKGYIAKANNIKPSVARGGIASPSDFGLNGGIASIDYNPATRRVTTGGIDMEHDPSSLLSLNTLSATSVGTGSSGSLLSSSPSVAGVNGVSKAQYERLKLDLKLKEADNRFLQEELENKDRMLGMLTEGLKEVEISQTQWLTTNQELSYELDRALQQNKALKIEMTRLKEQLQLTASDAPAVSQLEVEDDENKET